MTITCSLFCSWTGKNTISLVFQTELKWTSLVVITNIFFRWFWSFFFSYFDYSFTSSIFSGNVNLHFHACSSLSVLKYEPITFVIVRKHFSKVVFGLKFYLVVNRDVIVLHFLSLCDKKKIILYIIPLAGNDIM